MMISGLRHNPLSSLRHSGQWYLPFVHFNGRKKKPWVHHDRGLWERFGTRRGPRRNGGKQVRAVPGQSLSYKDKEIKPPEKC